MSLGQSYAKTLILFSKEDKMNQKNLQKEWQKLIKEINDKPKYHAPYPPQVVFMRELLLAAQVFLEKIESEQNCSFGRILYQKVMAKYYRQKLTIRLEEIR